MKVCFGAYAAGVLFMDSAIHHQHYPLHFQIASFMLFNALLYHLHLSGKAIN